MMKIFMRLPFFGLALVSVVAHAKPILSAQCGEPSGQRLDYIKSTVKASADSFTGSRPTFLIDSDKPGSLLVVWPDSQSLGSARRQNAVEAIIVNHTGDMITAVYAYEKQIDMYSLYPKFGIVYLSSHKLIPIAEVPSALSFSAKCWFDISEQK